MPDSSLGAGARVRRVAVETELGGFVIELFDERAPLTSAHFLALVESMAYRGGAFHRSLVPDNQPGQDVTVESVQATAHPSMLPRVPALPLERTSLTGLRHVDGAVSMARLQGRPDSARADFFICVGDQPELDCGGRRAPDGQGFAAFGRVESGMDTVRLIQRAPRSGQALRPPVRIRSIAPIREVP